MSEPHDPLRSLFKEAAAAGQSRAHSAPPSFITERGERVHRRRILALAVGACLVFSGAGAAAASLLPESPDTSVPATTPSTPRPSPASSLPDSPRTSPPPTGLPSSGRNASETPAFPGWSASETPAFPGWSASETPAFPGRSASGTPTFPGSSPSRASTTPTPSNSSPG
ncbi:hypothetical protein ABZ826_07600 [Streptomyces sp. NPDC047515]|uniref:hypothetical protein n=1 Tax=Streptomyces sp. NPDC047515 TaxID=3155380 RepID=UPI0033FD4894